MLTGLFALLMLAAFCVFLSDKRLSSDRVRDELIRQSIRTFDKATENDELKVNFGKSDEHGTLTREPPPPTTKTIGIAKSLHQRTQKKTRTLIPKNPNRNSARPSFIHNHSSFIIHH